MHGTDKFKVQRSLFNVECPLNQYTNQPITGTLIRHFQKTSISF